jgi:hypothetical protein
LLNRSNPSTFYEPSARSPAKWPISGTKNRNERVAIGRSSGSNELASCLHTPNLIIEIATGLCYSAVTMAESKLVLKSDSEGNSKSLAEEARGTSLEISIHDGDGILYLTDNSIVHLQMRLSEFGTQVLKEARSIEHTEHVGSGAPEITAAHIDEAWWVSRRRIRRSKHPVLIAAMRIIETFGSAGVGIAATHLKDNWGAGLFIASTLFTVGAFLLEAQVSAKD